MTTKLTLDTRQGSFEKGARCLGLPGRTHRGFHHRCNRPSTREATARTDGMKEFFDTSVLVASFWSGHVDHEVSLKRVAAANKNKSACALHTLAEVYASMTALPVKNVIPPDQALLFVQEVSDRFSIVTLS